MAPQLVLFFPLSDETTTSHRLATGSAGDGEFKVEAFYAEAGPQATYLVSGRQTGTAKFYEFTLRQQ
jgi:hypothetical protein